MLDEGQVVLTTSPMLFWSEHSLLSIIKKACEECSAGLNTAVMMRVLRVLQDMAAAPKKI